MTRQEEKKLNGSPSDEVRKTLLKHYTVKTMSLEMKMASSGKCKPLPIKQKVPVIKG